MSETIRALSWNQPYASMMLHGKIETRRYPTKVRGMVLICSCKVDYPLFKQLDISGLTHILRMGLILKDDCTLKLKGMAIAIGNLVDCRRMAPEDEELSYVIYNPDLYVWIFENVTPIKAFPWKGKQGWSILDQSLNLDEIL